MVPNGPVISTLEPAVSSRTSPDAPPAADAATDPVRVLTRTWSPDVAETV
jgi:hypothetical protein